MSEIYFNDADRSLHINTTPRKMKSKSLDRPLHLHMLKGRTSSSRDLWLTSSAYHALMLLDIALLGFFCCTVANHCNLGSTSS